MSLPDPELYGLARSFNESYDVQCDYLFEAMINATAAEFGEEPAVLWDAVANIQTGIFHGVDAVWPEKDIPLVVFTATTTEGTSS